MARLLCIYHGNCQDGFGAAWAVRHALGNEVEFYPGVYQNDPPDVAGRDVILVDFSYKRTVLDAMAQTARSITIIDHHKSAEEDLAPFTVQLCGGARFRWADVAGSHADLAELGRPSILAHFDMERSGAGMAWDTFCVGERPALINHIEDRDLWRFKLPATRQIAAAVFSYPYDFALWDRLMMTDLDRLAIEGAAIERKHHQDIANLLPVVQRQMVIGGEAIPVACLPLTMTSDAGHKMAVDCGTGIAACYWDTPEGRVFSLRSTDDGPDVSAIAKQYGGGGHSHAAGFRMPRGWEGDAA